jgi:peptidoglycan hydrolase-like protein with peptidoglycan-binding domain
VGLALLARELVCALNTEATTRKTVLTTASILALSIGGAGMGLAAGMSNTAPNAGANMPAASGTYNQSQSAVNPSRDEVRQAQQQLEGQGRYHGAIDGVLGPQTKQVIEQFQQKNDLQVTATLDQQTMNKLFGTMSGGQGSSTPTSPAPQGAGNTGPRVASPAGSNLSDHNAPGQQR